MASPRPMPAATDSRSASNRWALAASRSASARKAAASSASTALMRASSAASRLAARLARSRCTVGASICAAIRPVRRWDSDNTDSSAISPPTARKPASAAGNSPARRLTPDGVDRCASASSCCNRPPTRPAAGALDNTWLTRISTATRPPSREPSSTSPRLAASWSSSPIKSPELACSTSSMAATKASSAGTWGARASNCGANCAATDCTAAPTDDRSTAEAAPISPTLPPSSGTLTACRLAPCPCKAATSVDTSAPASRWVSRSAASAMVG